MATQQTVWFADGTDRWFDTQAKALAFEQRAGIATVLIGTGLNEEAAKKAAKAIQDAYTVTPK